jgi:hypothetical protein
MGVASLDTFCETSASAAGLDGTFIALVSTGAVPAAQRLAQSRGWVRLDGLPILDQPILDDSVRRSVALDEHGADVNGYAMTGTGTDGTSMMACSGWTTATGTSRGGLTDWAGTTMFSNSGGTCSERIYCFELGRNEVVAEEPFLLGRYLFVSTAVFTSGGGIGPADAICASEAAAAGLLGEYRAMLPTMSESIAERLGSLAGIWRRPDQIVVSWRGIDQLPLEARFDQSATGGPVNPSAAWAGPFSLTDRATPADSCNDWTATSGSVEGFILPHSSRMFIGAGGGISCTAQLSVVCAQL